MQENIRNLLNACDLIGLERLIQEQRIMAQQVIGLFSGYDSPEQRAMILELCAKSQGLFLTHVVNTAIKRGQFNFALGMIDLSSKNKKQSLLDSAYVAAVEVYDENVMQILEQKGAKDHSADVIELFDL